MHSFGTCAPYTGESNFCDNYISLSDYVFILSEHQNIHKNISALERIMSTSSLQCRDLVSAVICNYYFAPCGNSTNGVHLPLSVCQDECECVSEDCSLLWTQAQEILAEENLDIIDCSDTSSRFKGLSLCCSGLGINLLGK